MQNITSFSYYTTKFTFTANASTIFALVVHYQKSFKYSSGGFLLTAVEPSPVVRKQFPVYQSIRHSCGSLEHRLMGMSKLQITGSCANTKPDICTPGKVCRKDHVFQFDKECVLCRPRVQVPE